MFILKMGALQSAELSYNIREASIGCRSIVPSSLPSCLPPLRSHTGALSHPSRGECTQTSNCSDRRALVCYSRAAVARKGRQAVGEAGGSAGEQAEGKEKRGDGDWALHNPTRASRRIQAGMCPLRKPAGTHSHACCSPQPAQADVFLGIVVPLLL